MKTLLQLNSSIFSSGGQSTQLADQFVVTWRANELETQVKVRDLAHDPISRLSKYSKFKCILISRLMDSSRLNNRLELIENRC